MLRPIITDHKTSRVVRIYLFIDFLFSDHLGLTRLRLPVFNLIVLYVGVVKIHPIANLSMIFVTNIKVYIRVRGVSPN